MVKSSSTSPLLVGVPPPPQTSDPQLHALLNGVYSRFGQWKVSGDITTRSVVRWLRTALEHLLDQLLGARDYAGAAQVLSVVYHRFTLIPSRCIQASLEILRRKPGQHKDELLQFYQTALQSKGLDELMVKKEILMLHIASGDYYDAYHFFKAEVQQLSIQQDAHLLGVFGMLCYWLIFIESDELREKFVFDQSPQDDDDDFRDDDEYGGSLRPRKRKRGEKSSGPQGPHEILRTRFSFKTPIGVHILYQDSIGAFNRAVSLCPESAVFLEYYIQLLTMVGEVGRACDHLENFYHSNPSNPHAARMLTQFLERHFPLSISNQATAYARWVENDPMCRLALEKVLDFGETHVIPASTFVHVLASVLDHHGSDVQLAQSRQITCRLWKQFAQAIVACETGDEAQFAMIEDVRLSRLWWCEAFFCRPRSAAAVEAIANKYPEMIEALVFKAVCGYRLFGTRGAGVAKALKEAKLEEIHTKLIKSHIPESMPISGNMAELQVPSHRDTPDWVSVHIPVMNRSVINKHTSHAQPPKIMVTRRDGEAQVDLQLIAALEEAVASELGESSQHLNGATRKRSFTQMQDIRDEQEERAAVPIFVSVLEELIFMSKGWQSKVFSFRHIQTQLQLRLRGVNAVMPSLLEVRAVIRYFQDRWTMNEALYGFPGLLHRYDSFLARFIRQHAKDTNFWRTNLTAPYVTEAMRQMKLHVSRSQTFFPRRDHVEIVLRVKAASCARTRRLLLREYMLAMRDLAYHVDFVTTEDLVATAASLAKMKGHFDFLSTEDLTRWAETVLVRRYSAVVAHLGFKHREFLLGKEMENSSDDPNILLRAIKRRFHITKATLNQMKAFVWVRQWLRQHPFTWRELLEGEQEPVDGSSRPPVTVIMC
ncbi:hypothetical protein Poli38472_014154 [Pythium oligandrum]|uniref:Uncharacterized protein n=1 Tax=Pythium oligandrum TaxID=41045 RepID=A0A8K1FLP1_PYTOL|nr:hypothetical protein Poli38472_014154 [Pythium oligandrum]|eukprot:TMW64037.1 hypothetical protein Poli38472_014154 [Pythium oligandrum]